MDLKVSSQPTCWLCHVRRRDVRVMHSMTLSQCDPTMKPYCCRIVRCSPQQLKRPLRCRLASGRATRAPQGHYQLLMASPPAPHGDAMPEAGCGVAVQPSKNADCANPAAQSTATASLMPPGMLGGMPPDLAACMKEQMAAAALLADGRTSHATSSSIGARHSLCVCH